MAGRDTPLMRPMRSSALAMVAPVLPALTMAEARPSRTASAARTSDESFMVRTLLAGVGVHGDDLGGRDHLEAVGVAELVGSTDQHHRHAELLHGLHAPRDDLAGCLVAAHGVDGDGEDAHGRRRSGSVDVDGLAAVVPAAVAAHHVGRFTAPHAGRCCAPGR